MPGSLPLPETSAASRVTGESPAPKGRRKPTLSQIILQAAAGVSAASRGASLAAIKKMLAREGYDVGKNKGRIKTVLRHLLSNGALLRVSGSGASGSFRLQRGSGALKAKKKPAAVKRRKSSAKKSTEAPKPHDTRGNISPAASRAKGPSRSPGKPRGTVATRRKQILDDIIKGTFLME